MYNIDELRCYRRYSEYIDYDRLDEYKLNERFHKVLNALYDIYDSFNEHQIESFNLLNNKEDNRVQFRHPTGCGKGYLMIANILTNIVNGENIQAILSHRLMLNNQHILDLINLIISYDLIQYVSFACIGSDNSIERNFFKILAKNDPSTMKRLFNTFVSANVSQSSFILSTTDRNLFGEYYDTCKAENRIMIITSTYNSCSILSDYYIDSLYCDEAHTICTNRIDEDTVSFLQNLSTLNYTNKYFFTATPKDSDGNYKDYSKLLDTKYGLVTKKPKPKNYKHINDYYYDLERYEDYLLYSQNKSDLLTNQFMDNETLFGKIHEIQYTEAIKNLYITTPVIKTVLACNYRDEFISLIGNRSVTGLKGKIKAIVDTFKDLSDNTKELTTKYNLNAEFEVDMEAKLLIKSNSALDVYHLFQEVINTNELSDVNIAYCTSMYGTQIRTSEGKIIDYGERREEFIGFLQGLKLNEKLIVIHCDIMAEGINVWGFNGLLLLTTKEMSSITKVLQNIGRTTRLLDIDRDMIRSLRKSGTPVTYDNRLSHMLKPYSFVYLLQFDDMTKKISDEIKSHLNRLLSDTCDYNGATVIGLGNEDYYISLENDDFFRENQLDKIHIGEKYDKSIIYSESDELIRLKILDLIRNSSSTLDKIKNVYNM